MTTTPEAQATRRRPRAFHSIVYGGLLIGVLDSLFAVIFYGRIRGIPITRIFQSVAAGLLGHSSYQGYATVIGV